jgi:nucleotide-binding universal stress UspA family protein
MYKKMLVLLDGSKLAEAVFSYAQELSGRLKIDLELLHVCSSQEAEQLPMRQAYMEHMAEVLQKKAEEIRSASAAKPTDKAIEAKGTVVTGNAAEEILKYAGENKIDIIMLSTHGRSGSKLWDLGSVANKVIHAANVPIWLVPSELRTEVIYDKLPRRTLVIPLDGDKVSETVIPHAINIAKQRGAESELLLLYVDHAASTAQTHSEIEESKAKKQAMKKYLDDVVQRIKGEGIPARSEILLGDPAGTIIDYIKNNPPQLLAMTVKSGLSRMIFGSVTENVLHLVKKTPIFLVRP